ncbi:hypothetical protein CF98_16635 [Halopseudomonas bauzanensis]|nr:hypothetical protein CF98_16635 [Halopseudomonas bauzanensis]
MVAHLQSVAAGRQVRKAQLPHQFTVQPIGAHVRPVAAIQAHPREVWGQRRQRVGARRQQQRQGQQESQWHADIPSCRLS